MTTIRGLINYLEQWDGSLPLNDGEFQLSMLEEMDFIVIKSRTYKILQEESNFLAALEECGVDNWSGYSDACSLVKEDE
jgi:hypothetical protein